MKNVTINGPKLNEVDDAYSIIHHLSALTHGHHRSMLACGLYISIASELLKEADLSRVVQEGLQKAVRYYKTQPAFQAELEHFKRLESHSFAATPEERIKSSGYVIHTLEAAIWCMLNSESYQGCVLKAVNLGEDTDTVATVAGGLAGLFYGYESIPQEWLAVIARRDFIESLCRRLLISLHRADMERL